jgi:hypothetical protein
LRKHALLASLLWRMPFAACPVPHVREPARYAQVLMHPASKVAVVVVFVGLAGVLGYIGMEKTSTGFELVDLTPDDSYVRDFFDIQESAFGSVVGRLPTKLYFKQLEYHEAGVQGDMVETADQLLGLQTIDQGVGLDSWHLSFTAWAWSQQSTWGPSNFKPSTYVCENIREGLCPKQFLTGDVVFYQALRQWLSSSGQRFLDDMRLNDARDRILSSRVSLSHVVMESSSSQVEGLVTSQDACQASAMEPKPFVSSYPYIYFDQYRIIKAEMFTNFGLCLLATTLICLMVLVHPLVCAVMAVAMLMIGMSLIRVYGMLMIGMSLIPYDWYVSDPI